MNSNSLHGAPEREGLKLVSIGRLIVEENSALTEYRDMT